MSAHVMRRGLLYRLALVLPIAGCASLDGLAGGDPLESGSSSGQPEDDRPAAGGAATDDGDGTGRAAARTAACAEGQEACGGACVDLATDAANCGRCGHSCLGGACNRSKCQPVQLASQLGIPQGLAVAPEGVYVTLYTNKVVRIGAKGGAAPEVLTTSTSAPSSIAVVREGDRTKGLVWGEQNGASSNIVFCDLPCTTLKKTPVAGSIGQVAVSGPNAYWTTSSASSGGIQRCSVSGCTGKPFDVVEGQPDAYGLVVSGGQLAFSVRAAAGVVRRAASTGAGIVDLIPGVDGPKILATDGVTLYVAATGSNVIARCPLTGCAPGQQATIALATNPHSVATDGENVYWTNGLATGGFVSWCPAGSCSGTGQVLAADQPNPYTVVVDGDAVYWTNSAAAGSLMKIARP
jgi:hypothetical protein